MTRRQLRHWRRDSTGIGSCGCACHSHQPECVSWGGSSCRHQNRRSQGMDHQTAIDTEQILCILCWLHARKYPCPTNVSAFSFQGTVEVQQLDLADLSSVSSLASKLQSEAKIDMLILNAGVAWGPLRYTKDNFEMQVGTNHFGHFALVQSLLPKLKQQVRLPYHVQQADADNMLAPVQTLMRCSFKTKSNTTSDKRIMHIAVHNTISFTVLSQYNDCIGHQQS